MTPDKSAVVRVRHRVKTFRLLECTDPHRRVQILLSTALADALDL